MAGLISMALRLMPLGGFALIRCTHDHNRLAAQVGEYHHARFVAGEAQIADQGGGFEGRAALFDGDLADVMLAQVEAQALELEGEPGFHRPGAGEGGGFQMGGGQVGDIGVELGGVELLGQGAHQAGAQDGGVGFV